jgi:hypothetical protein
MDEDLPLAEQLANTIGFFGRIFRKQFKEMPDMLRSASTLSLVIAHGETVTAMWTGDSPIHLSRKIEGGYDTTIVTIPDQMNGMLTDHFGGQEPPCTMKHETFSFAPGDIITASSDGLIVTPEIMGEIYSRVGFNRLEDVAHHCPCVEFVQPGHIQNLQIIQRTPSALLKFYAGSASLRRAPRG